MCIYIYLHIHIKRVRESGREETEKKLEKINRVVGLALMVWTLANLFWLFSVGLVVLFSPPSGQSVVSVGVEFCWNFPPFLSSQIRVTSSIHRDELIQTHRFSTYHGAMKYTWLNMTYLEKILTFGLLPLTADFHGSPSKTTTTKTCRQRTSQDSTQRPFIAPCPERPKESGSQSRWPGWEGEGAADGRVGASR